MEVMERPRVTLDSIREAFRASRVVINESNTFDLAVRRDVLGQEILRELPIGTVINDELDANEPDAFEALVWMHQGFSRDFWNGRTVGDFLRRHGFSADTKTNVVQFPAAKVNADGVHRQNLTLAGLREARSIGEGKWLLPSGLVIRFL